MYSVVLMAALTTGGNAPDGHFRGSGCCGCCGYYGGWGGYGYYNGGGNNRGWGDGVGYGMVPGSYDGPMFHGAVAPADTTTTSEKEKLNQPTPDTNKDKDKDTMAPARAKLIVELPSDAILYIDGLPMSKTSEVRSFNTPVLRRGQAFYYLVRAEIIRDGKPVMQTRRVIVRAGQTVRANFKDMDTEAVATAQAK